LGGNFWLGLSTGATGRLSCSHRELAIEDFDLTTACNSTEEGRNCFAGDACCPAPPTRDAHDPHGLTGRPEVGGRARAALRTLPAEALLVDGRFGRAALQIDPGTERSIAASLSQLLQYLNHWGAYVTSSWSGARGPGCSRGGGCYGRSGILEADQVRRRCCKEARQPRRLVASRSPVAMPRTELGFLPERGVPCVSAVPDRRSHTNYYICPVFTGYRLCKTPR